VVIQFLALIKPVKDNIINIYFTSCLIGILALFAITTANANKVLIDAFGLHVHGLHRGNPWPAVRFGFLRLWDSGTQWRQLEPRKGDWQFKRLDQIVRMANNHGVKLLMTLGQTPLWAAADPNAESPYRDGASSPPRDLSDWRNYVKQIGKRYKGKIRHWEVWNEINVKHFWSGDLRTMVEMERIAVEILKSIDPDNLVLTPSIQGGAYKWLDRYLDAGGGRYADAISYHFYAPTHWPEEVAGRILRVRELLVNHGLGNKPIWNTETGWLFENSDGKLGRRMRPAWRNWKKVGYKAAAGVVARTYLVNLANGVEHIFWYAWDNSAMGLTEDHGRKMKPAAYGYERMVEWLLGADIHGCNDFNDIWICRLSVKDQNQYIVWGIHNSDFYIPELWRVDILMRMDGKQESLGIKRKIRIGPMPVLLRSSLSAKGS